ncbi:MAG: glycosyltransferase family 4 protein [Candidatus Angelobacter sp.]
MRIALIAPPFIAVPPKKYGGTELFLGELASGLANRGIEVTLYTNGESTLPVPMKWLYEKAEWPLTGEVEANLKSLNHSAWAVQDASRCSDVIHMNNAPGLTLGRFVDVPLVYTVHHPYEQDLTEFYRQFPEVSYVSISEFQRRKLAMPRSHTIHHGINIKNYRFQSHKQSYLSFIGRIAPVKGTHLAIAIAQKSGIPLKIAGEIQPLYRAYWENEVKPHVDGRFIEYVGEMGLEEKNGLLGNSMAMVFPIQWDEPFGLVLVEAMACGTPVLALPGGSVEEIVKEGVSGHVRATVEELAKCAKDLSMAPETVRKYAETFFSRERMVSDYIEFYSDILGEHYGAEEEPIVA